MTTLLSRLSLTCDAAALQVVMKRRIVDGTGEEPSGD
jgi:hypothetical protein